MAVHERGEKCSAHVNFARALKNLEAASNNLSFVSEKNGNTKCREASRLVSQLRNALEYGECYPLSPFATVFDAANKE